MIRIVTKTDDAGMAANVGGSVWTSFRIFDVELPDLEAWLTRLEPDGAGPNSYAHVQVIGVEVLQAPPAKKEDA